MSLWRYFSLLSIGTLVALAACTDQAETPLTAPPTESSAAASARSGASLTAESGRYLLLARGASQRVEREIEALGGELEFFHPPTGFGIVLGLDKGAATRLARHPDVSELQPDVALSLDVPKPAVRAGDRIQSQADPTTAILFPWQWNLQAIDAPAAWAAGHLGSPDVTLAIIDTGLDYDAFDLDGLVDLSRSVSFVPEDDELVEALFPTRHPISDLHGHGTNVATQASSTAFAFAGVSSMTTLMGVKVLNAQGTGFLGQTLQGVLWAADHGADVLNLSLGGAFLKQGNGRTIGFINQLFGYVGQQGALIVVAAGNDALNLDRFGDVFFTYCDTPHVVCVSATGPGVATASPDEPAIYTNFGRSAISVAAPGGNFRSPLEPSLWPWGVDIASWVWSLCSKTLLVFDEDGNVVGAPCISGGFVLGAVGTSQASPHVAGLAALLFADRGGNPARIKSRILQSAEDLGQPGTDPFYGKGRIHVPTALGIAETSAASLRGR